MGTEERYTGSHETLPPDEREFVDTTLAFWESMEKVEAKYQRLIRRSRRNSKLMLVFTITMLAFVSHFSLELSWVSAWLVAPVAPMAGYGSAVLWARWTSSRRRRQRPDGV